MDNATFLAFREQFNAECEAIMENRRHRYATEQDRFSNFKVGATARRTPLDIWLTFAEKHWLAVKATTEALAAGELIPETGQDLFSSHRDLRNFLDLGVGLIASLAADRPDLFKRVLEAGDMVDTPYGQGWVVCRFEDTSDYRVTIGEDRYTLPRAALIYLGRVVQTQDVKDAVEEVPEPTPVISPDRKVRVMDPEEAHRYRHHWDTLTPEQREAVAADPEAAES